MPQEAHKGAFQWITHVFQTCFLWRWLVMRLLLRTNLHILSLYRHICMLLILPPPSMHLTLPLSQPNADHYHLHWLMIHSVLYPPTPL